MIDLIYFVETELLCKDADRLANQAMDTKKNKTCTNCQSSCTLHTYLEDLIDNGNLTIEPDNTKGIPIQVEAKPPSPPNPDALAAVNQIL